MEILAIILVAIGFAIFIGGLNRIPSIPRVRYFVLNLQDEEKTENPENSQSFKLLTRPELNLRYQTRIGMSWLSKPGPILTILVSLIFLSAFDAFYPFAPPLLFEIMIGGVLSFVFFSGPHRLYNIEYYLNEIWKLSAEFLSEIDKRIADRTTRDFTKWIIVQMLCGIMLVTVAVQPFEFILLTGWIVATVSASIFLFGYALSKFTFRWIENLIVQDIEFQ
ncbi:MAG: hypothetical protein GF411_12690 [Candidatus Lokiarchaeota archaeon]|nr:hypothetical protein [Candidatus Lokiarchaeota archaeon]